MTALWTVGSMAEAMGGRTVDVADADVTGLSIDSRTLEPGEAYFAIRGEVHDGHSFVGPAANAGASVCVVSEREVHAFVGSGLPLLVVDDTLKGLERLAVAARDRTDAKVVAVTGSVGKTTTKEMMRCAFSALGRVHAAVASFNNHWGVPLTLARMPTDTQFAIIEIGMNHPGEITPLVRMAKPHVGVITIVAAAHLGAFASVDEIADAKAEIFDGVIEGGTALLNADDERLPRLRAKARARGLQVRTFGTSEHADYREVPDALTAPGEHLRQNARIVVATAEILGVDGAEAGAALAEFAPGKGRGERHVLSWDGGTVKVIDESYNANPASMNAAIASLASTAADRRVAVLGDMLELGTHSRALHEALADVLDAANVDRVFLAGPEMEALHARLPGSIWRRETLDLAAPLLQEINAGDAVMLKSSLGLGFARLVGAVLEKQRA